MDIFETIDKIFEEVATNILSNANENTEMKNIVEYLERAKQQVTCAIAISNASPVSSFVQSMKSINRIVCSE